jgi:hypothetical protein
MIALFIDDARHTRHLHFGLLSPIKEPDWDGIEEPQVDPSQYVRLTQKLSQKLDAFALSAIRYVGHHAGTGSLTIAGSLVNLPIISSLAFSSHSMATIPVSGQAFTFTLTEGSTHTLTTSLASVAIETGSSLSRGRWLRGRVALMGKQARRCAGWTGAGGLGAALESSISVM